VQEKIQPSGPIKKAWGKWCVDRMRNPQKKKEGWSLREPKSNVRHNGDEKKIPKTEGEEIFLMSCLGGGSKGGENCPPRKGSENNQGEEKGDVSEKKKEPNDGGSTIN